MARKDGRPRVTPDLSEEIYAPWSEDLDFDAEPTHDLIFDNDKEG
jgi:hypothetical protein